MIAGRHRKPGGQMGRGVNGGKPVLDVFLAQWPTLIFLPAILVLVVVLVTVTRWWDRRDESRLAEKEARRAGTPARPTGDEVIASPPPKPGDRSRRPVAVVVVVVATPWPVPVLRCGRVSPSGQE